MGRWAGEPRTREFRRQEKSLTGTVPRKEYIMSIPVAENSSVFLTKVAKINLDRWDKRLDSGENTRAIPGRQSRK